MTTADGAAASSGRSRNFVTGLLSGAAIAALVAFVLWPAAAVGPEAGPGAGPGAAPSGPPPGFGPAPVEVVAAVETVAAEPVQLLGSVSPVRESLVASEVDGLAAELSVDEGDTVRKGDILVRLRTVALEQEIAGARAASEELEARSSRAQTDFDRLELLLARQAISQREYDQAVADREALSQGVTRLDAETARLEDMLERATVRAPFSGRVTAVHVEIGEWVGRGDRVVSLVDLSQVEVRVQIAERFISAVSKGFDVEARFDALPGRTYSGQVTAVVPQALAEARTFPVLVRIDNKDMSIKGGMSARVVAQLGNPERALLVAKDAVVRRGDQVLLFRVAIDESGSTSDGAEEFVGVSGTVEQVAVEAGPARGQWQVVYGPVAAGDLLIVRGNERVGPGQPVVVAGVRDLPIPEADPDLPIAVDPRHTRPS